MDFTLVVHGGDEGFAAVVDGSSSLFAPGAPASGFTDGLLASYLIREANRMSPLLLLEVLSNNQTSLRQEKIDTHTSLPAVHDAVLGLSVIFDPATDLPYIIRSYESHGVLGQSTQDLVVQSYTTVSDVKFPTRLKSVYNGYNVISDFIVRDVLVNSVTSTAFEGPGNRRPENVPTTSVNYSFAEVGEYFESNVWGGEYRGTFANIRAVNPYPELPGLWVLTFQDADLYRQIVYEFEDFVVVLDCPPHQSLLVIRWVKEKLRKPLKYVWPSHHHHDHIWGITDFVKAGAKVVALDIARDYYSAIPRDSTKKPFMLRDKKMQVTFVHMERSVHAADYSYAFATSRCPTANSTAVIFNADDYNPASGLGLGDHSVITTSLSALAEDGVPKNIV
ncbi:hypothetical protein ACHAQA_010107 [Verticillium albo-atrum]